MSTYKVTHYHDNTYTTDTIGRDDARIRQALKMNKLLLTNNFVKFFKELHYLPPLSKCSLLIHLDELKRYRIT